MFYIFTQQLCQGWFSSCILPFCNQFSQSHVLLLLAFKQKFLGIYVAACFLHCFIFGLVYSCHSYVMKISYYLIGGWIGAQRIDGWYWEREQHITVIAAAVYMHYVWIYPTKTRPNWLKPVRAICVSGQKLTKANGSCPFFSFIGCLC